MAASSNSTKNSHWWPQRSSPTDHCWSAFWWASHASWCPPGQLWPGPQLHLPCADSKVLDSRGLFRAPGGDSGCHGRPRIVEPILNRPPQYQLRPAEPLRTPPARPHLPPADRQTLSLSASQETWRRPKDRHHADSMTIGCQRSPRPVNAKPGPRIMRGPGFICCAVRALPLPVAGTSSRGER